MVSDTVAALERDAPRQHFVQHAPERPDVGPFVNDLAPCLLRTHIARRAHHGTVARVVHGLRRRVCEVGRRAIASGLREAEVEDLHHAVRRDRDVGGLQVAVDNPFFVGDVEGLGDLPRDAQRVTNGQPRALRPLTRDIREGVRERLPVHELENQEPDAFGFLEAVDRADVRMIQRGEHPRLPLEAREPLGVARERVRQELDRDIALELRVARAVHLTHAARTEQGLHLIHTKSLAFHHQPRLVTSVVAPNHRGCLEKALRALVRRQQGLHLLAQRVVAAAGLGQVRRAPIRWQRPRAREHLFQTRPVVSGKDHLPWILLAGAVTRKL